MLRDARHYSRRKWIDVATLETGRGLARIRDWGTCFARRADIHDLTYSVSLGAISALSD